jgi:hypothetical protein
MTDMVNLWPAELEVTKLIPPVTILRQQASMLGQLTGNRVLSDVKARDGEDDTFTYDFYIVAPSLNNYRYKLLTISHGVDLFPVTIQVEESIYKEIDSPKYFKDNKVHHSFWTDSEDNFLEILKAIFNSSKAKRVISSLLVQSIDNQKTPS